MYPTSGESCWYSCIHSPCSLPAEHVTSLSQSKASCGSGPQTAFLSFPRQFLPECCHTLNHASFLDEAIHFLPVKFYRNVWFSVPKEQEQSRKRQSAANADYSEPRIKLHLTHKEDSGEDFMKDTFHIYTQLISTCPDNTAFQLGWKTILFY